MSEQTLEALSVAIAAHVADLEPGVVVTDWFVAAAMSSFDGEAVSYSRMYAASDSAPHAVLGLVTMSVDELVDDCRGEDE